MILEARLCSRSGSATVAHDTLSNVEAGLGPRNPQINFEHR